MRFSRVLLMLVLQITVGFTVVSKVFADEIDAQGLYKAHCVLCHGDDGKGKTDMGKGLGARDFTEKGVLDSVTDEKIIEQIEKGSNGKMFPFKGKLTQEEIKALVPVLRAFAK